MTTKKCQEPEYAGPFLPNSTSVCSFNLNGIHLHYSGIYSSDSVHSSCLLLLLKCQFLSLLFTHLQSLLVRSMHAYSAKHPKVCIPQLILKNRNSILFTMW